MAQSSLRLMNFKVCLTVSQKLPKHILISLFQGHLPNQKRRQKDWDNVHCDHLHSTGNTSALENNNCPRPTRTPGMPSTIALVSSWTDSGLDRCLSSHSGCIENTYQRFSGPIVEGPIIVYPMRTNGQGQKERKTASIGVNSPQEQRYFPSDRHAAVIETLSFTIVRNVY